MTTKLTIAAHRRLLTRWGIAYKSRDTLAVLVGKAEAHITRSANRYGPRATVAQRRAMRKAQRRLLRDIAAVS